MAYLLVIFTSVVITILIINKALSRTTVQWNIRPVTVSVKSKILKALIEEGHDVDVIYDKLKLTVTFLTSNRLALIQTLSGTFTKILDNNSPWLYAEELGKLANGNTVNFGICYVYDKSLDKRLNPVLNAYIMENGEKKVPVGDEKHITQDNALINKELVFQFPQICITNSVAVHKGKRKMTKFLKLAEKELDLRNETFKTEGFDWHTVDEYERETGLPATTSTDVYYESRDKMFKFSILDSGA